MHLFLFITLINIVAVLLFNVDKKQAVHGGWRIPEATFFLLSILGATVALCIAMSMLRHKNRKGKFKYRIYLILLLQIILLALISVDMVTLPNFVEKLLQP